MYRSTALSRCSLLYFAIRGSPPSRGESKKTSPPRAEHLYLITYSVGHGITQRQVGEALCVPSSRISEIERGKRDLPELEQRAIQWIFSITDPKTTRPNT